MNSHPHDNVLERRGTTSAGREGHGGEPLNDESLMMAGGAGPEYYCNCPAGPSEQHPSNHYPGCNFYRPA